jgi:lipoprotein-anchoring transpeptidase ErfK/SrfK
MSLYHCSIAADRRKRPTEKCVIDNVVENPKYTFDPVNWPEVKDVKQKLLIPAGPRNPVGLCWIGLSKKGYGIHGTPEPENIGKTGSHGCFRLTNWDALRLARQVRIGAGVRFTESPAEVAIAESPTKRR